MSQELTTIQSHHWLKERTHDTYAVETNHQKRIRSVDEQMPLQVFEAISWWHPACRKSWNLAETTRAFQSSSNDYKYNLHATFSLTFSLEVTTHLSITVWKHPQRSIQDFNSHHRWYQCSIWSFLNHLLELSYLLIVSGILVRRLHCLFPSNKPTTSQNQSLGTRWVWYILGYPNAFGQLPWARCSDLWKVWITEASVPDRLQSTLIVRKCYSMFNTTRPVATQVLVIVTNLLELVQRKHWFRIYSARRQARWKHTMTSIWSKCMWTRKRDVISILSQGSHRREFR